MTDGQTATIMEVVESYESTSDFGGRFSSYRPRQIAIVLFDYFNLSELSIVVDVLASANHFSGEQKYEWKIFSTLGRRVESRSGIVIEVDGGLQQCSGDTVVILGSRSKQIHDDKIRTQLRKIIRSSDKIVLLSESVVAMCRLGLLSQPSATVPTWCEAEIAEEFPDLELKRYLYECHGRITVCRGGLTTLDLFVSMISDDLGSHIGMQLAEAFATHRIRRGDECIPSFFSRWAERGSPYLCEAIDIMEKNVETPLTSKDIAQRIGISERQLQRLFNQFFQKTPRQLYRELRLLRARDLLAGTHLSVTDIAMAVGFISSSHFAKEYRKFFGVRPSYAR